MTKDQALCLALEALEKISRTQYHIETPPIESLEERMRRIADQAITTIKAALEAKDEPVAWIKRSAKGNIYDLLSEPDDSYEPVYTTPPQRKPLTDEEIYLCTNHIDRNARGWANEFARAIEAKLKEKNS
jgi:hypothetical protein